MGKLTVDDFGDFFRALWDKTPFSWQRELAAQVLTSHDMPWPEAIALPTAAGKTACIDIAVFALAVQAHRLLRGEAITAPRRIFFVVDRRVIVDEAFDRAQQLAQALHEARDGVLATVAEALRLVARGQSDGAEEETPLTVHTLRGGTYRSESWARSPLQPAVIASTVDQFGSRLLFRAYGHRRPGMWPVYAGLAANDSLVLLDEAHCARPFLQTLQAVSRYRGWAVQPLQRCFYPVVLSATPPPGVKAFTDTSDEARNPEHPLGRRQLAHKPAILEEAESAKGAKAPDQFVRALVKAAEELVDDERQAIVVFVNRVATARAVHRLLRKKHAAQAILLTGRMRALDKDAVIAQRLQLLSSAASETRQLEEPLFVVATQTLEVGADLDFDALVSECASLDALRQRFGRLNRMGRPIEARSTILIRADQAGEGADDPVYGAALSKTWAWLQEQRDEGGVIDFGIAYLASHLPEDDALRELEAPARDAAVMLPAHLDCLAQTAPGPVPSPEVQFFLHGPRETAADVHVCWRIDLDLDAMSLCSPSAGETLPVPIRVFRHWLSGEGVEDAGSDVEGADGDLPTSEPIAGQIQVLRWRGRKTSESDLTSSPRDIRPGDIVVIPADAAGSTLLGDIPSSGGTESARLDIGDRAFILSRAKALLRLHPDLINCWPEGESRAKALAVLEMSSEDPDSLVEAVRDLLETLALETQNLPEFRWLHLTATQLQGESGRKTFRRNLYWIGDSSLVLIGQSLISDREITRQADTFSDEDDSSASGTSNREGGPIRLFAHLPGVETFARRFAKGSGLPDALVEAVAKAGSLHDLGKADPRFQALLWGGNRLAVGRELFAKSGEIPRTREAFKAARDTAGYPPGGRHELLSVRLAENAPGVLPEAPDLSELALHLIASHHGYCRPFAPVVFDAQPIPVTIGFQGRRMAWNGTTNLEQVDSGVAQRYWRLTRRYGWWGLAWLESLLRLADHRCSECEETNAAEMKHG
jgi:CRISPR-associated endonuclease/helicase Cas3